MTFLFAQEKVIADVEMTDALQGKHEVSFTAPELTWDDFQGKKEENQDWLAMTYSGIKLRYSYQHLHEQYLVKIELYPYMSQSKSWYQDVKNKRGTLEHEQLHFNITILVAKRLAEALRSMQFSSGNFAQQINKTHDNYLEQLKELQEQYDRETKHGLYMMQQRAWERKINAELNNIARNERGLY